MPVEGRYARQLVLPEIGSEGQRRLAASRAVVVGLGALGALAAGLLARAGVGRLRLIDRDLVERTNLQRQLLYDEADVGAPKAEVAAERLRQANPEIAIEGFARDVNRATAEALLRDADVIVDGTDNMETRFLLNEAALAWNRPFVYAGVIGTEGMVFAVVPPEGACLRCLLPQLPLPGSLPTCDTVGVMNSVAAVVAGIEMTATLKVLLGRPPSGELVAFDGWMNDLRHLRVGRRPDCPACVGGLREFLGARRGSVIAALCGGDVVSVDPLLDEEIDLEGLAGRLASVARVRRAGTILVAEVDGYTLTVFRDGRALIRGAGDDTTARSVYARFVGR